MSQTNLIVIEQASLAPWREDLDILDLALINHVHVRLTRRARQRVIIHEGVQCVWIHYPTIRAENWTITLSDRRLSARFLKMVKLGLLVKKQVSQGEGKGSKTYYGISEMLKKRFEEIDNRKDQDHGEVLTDFDRTPATAHSYDRTEMTAQYDLHPATAQSLSLSQGDIVCQSVDWAAPPSANAEPPPGARPETIANGLHSLLKAMRGGDVNSIRKVHL